MSENNNSIGMNELVNYEKKSYSPFMKFIMETLWKCGGSDKKILEYAPYSDHIKHAGIGGVVVATTVMAILAMGFAMHTIFASPDPSGAIDPITGEVALKGNWWITAPVALIWGLIIFNLDRFIVSTVKGDGTENIIIIPKKGKSSELLAMAPRLFMAVIIGLTISAPLETYIFKREIYREWKLSMKQLALSEEYRIEQENINLNKRTHAQFEEKDKQVKLQQEKYDKANQEYQDELSGKNTGNGWGDGPVAKKKERIKDLELQELNRLREELATIEKEKEKFKAEVEMQKEKSTKEVLASKPGFLDQIMMLERLAHTGKKVAKFDPVTNEVIKGKEDEIYGKASAPIWLVRILFMIIEVAPVIFKFMLNKSSYDWMQQNVEQILEAKQGISLHEVIDEKNNMHVYRENYNASRIAEVTKQQNDLEKENAIHAMRLYAAKEKEEIDKDPDKFIKND